MLEKTLSEDMTTLSAYLQTWQLKLSHAKTVTAAFHLYNQEAKRELKVKNNGKILPFCLVLTYLDVKLDKALRTVNTLRHCAKNYPRAFRCCGDLRVQDGAPVPRHCAALSLIYSTAEYCAPAWYRSAHTRFIDSVLNDALCIATGCLRITPTDNLPVFSGIQPAELRRQ